MARKTNDPAQDANKRLLAQIAERNRAQAEAAAPVDLGLDLIEPEPQTAAEFLRDEWDKKNFGEEIPTFSRMVYGPDPLIDNAPETKARIEAHGLERVAAAMYDEILLKEENAVPDPVLRKGLRAAIRRFGKENVAKAFAERIMKIPAKKVEVWAEREDELFGRPLEEAVQRYGRPGMAVKFLSERCISVLGMRGYEIVKDEKGEAVRVGTLLMGEIPQRKADQRREHWAEESRTQVREAEESFRGNTEREIHNGRAAGVAPLGRDEIVRAGATETRDYLDDARPSGFHVEQN